jgi:hypothetical protein
LETLVLQEKFHIVYATIKKGVPGVHGTEKRETLCVVNAMTDIAVHPGFVSLPLALRQLSLSVDLRRPREARSAFR